MLLSEEATDTSTISTVNTANSAYSDLNVYTNNLKLSTNGTERMRIDSGGDIKFSKNRADTVSNVTLHNANSQGFGTGIDFSCAYNGGYDLAKIDTENSNTGGQLRFYTSNTSGTIIERMKVNHLGNVGIGETSPDAKLHIRDATDGGSSSVTSAIQFSRRNGGSNDATIKMQHDGSDGVSNLQFHFGTTERMRINSSGIISTPNTGTTRPITHERAINIINCNVDSFSSWDQTPTNNSDGGNTTHSITSTGAYRLSNWAGGHSGNFLDVYCEAGLWVIKGSVRLTNTDGHIHGSTSSANYPLTAGLRFHISSGPNTGLMTWNADAAYAATGTTATRASFCSSAVSMTAGYKTVKYSTSGYAGIQQIYVTELQLVRVG